LAIDNPRIYISVSFGIIALLLINPFGLYRSSRFWLLKSLGRVLASGLFFVEFRDFFIADILNSITYTFYTLQLFVCGLALDFRPLPTCDLSSSWFVPFFVGLPPLIRLLQCVRRYRDTKDVIHLANLVKYLLGVVVVWISFSELGPNRRIAWIGIFHFSNDLVLATIRSIYTCYWDIQIDWTFFVGKPLAYRTPLLYPTWIYTPAVIFNIAVRFSWVFMIAPSVWLKVDELQGLVYAISFLEMLRRCSWCLFRLENEQVNNIGNFRVVREVPLPLEYEGDRD
jgi:hypothetical protein